MTSASSAEEQPEQFHLWYTEGLRAQERGALQLTDCQRAVGLLKCFWPMRDSIFFFFICSHVLTTMTTTNKDNKDWLPSRVH